MEALRYRAEDAARSVGRSAVREARVRELKTELLNSERLAAHFEDNPEDLNLLKHDVSLSKHPALPHLSHLPAYLRGRKRAGGGSGEGRKPGDAKRVVRRGRGGTVRVWAEEATSTRAAGGQRGREGRREGGRQGCAPRGRYLQGGEEEKDGKVEVAVSVKVEVAVSVRRA